MMRNNWDVIIIHTVLGVSAFIAWMGIVRVISNIIDHINLV